MTASGPVCLIDSSPCLIPCPQLGGAAALLSPRLWQQLHWPVGVPNVLVPLPCTLERDYGQQSYRSVGVVGHIRKPASTRATGLLLGGLGGLLGLLAIDRPIYSCKQKKALCSDTAPFSRELPRRGTLSYLFWLPLVLASPRPHYPLRALNSHNHLHHRHPSPLYRHPSAGRGHVATRPST